MDKTCILIVDDNPEIREIINVLLGGEGFEVSEAENGAQALTLIEQQDFDLIILDIMMPGPNGYQTCRKIRELSNAPILFLSARTKESDKTLGFSSGGDDYLWCFRYFFILDFFYHFNDWCFIILVTEYNLPLFFCLFIPF